jgi:Ribonuclease G/E
MTLRRLRPALHEMLTEPCGLGGLDGLGRVRDPVICAFDALRAAKHATLINPGRRIALAAEPRVIAALRGPAAAALAAFEARVGRPLDLRAQAGGETFEIVIE